MKRLICDIDDVLHRKFKMMCASKGISMKEQLKEFVEVYIQYSENEMDTTDLIKVLIQKERKQEWNNEYKKYKAKIDRKKQRRQWDKEEKEQARQDYEDRWVNAQKSYQNHRITRKRDKLRNEFKSMRENYNRQVDNTFFDNLNKDIKQCDYFIERVKIFNKEYPSNELKLENPIKLLKRLKNKKENS